MMTVGMIVMKVPPLGSAVDSRPLRRRGLVGRGPLAAGFVPPVAGTVQLAQRMESSMFPGPLN